MTEEIQSWKSSKTETTPLLVVEESGVNTALQTLADRYDARLVRIIKRAEAKNKRVPAAVLRYYADAIENVRRLANDVA